MTEGEMITVEAINGIYLSVAPLKKGCYQGLGNLGKNVPVTSSVFPSNRDVEMEQLLKEKDAQIQNLEQANVQTQEILKEKDTQIKVLEQANVQTQETLQDLVGFMKQKYGADIPVRCSPT
ncbi:unnamed protein product [Microthlaspi erraticum]|uniref:Uncharacterized protein n=1 Tax=Microthlaspi erraticum TaxID=1685480 RepID=A0A6D2I056_9BRAS|nr:unnamed protein product [Microthlaspi erraticum]CAA7052632.1 unnamed protein product [Microthlaspi erraticum]